MTRKKQVNTENGAVLNRDFPRRGRSLIMVPEELRRLFPNVKPEYIDLAIKRFGDYRARFCRDHCECQKSSQKLNASQSSLIIV